MLDPAAQDEVQQRLSRSDGIFLIAIVVFACTIYILSPVTTSTDSAWTFHVAASLLRQRNIDLDEYRGNMNLEVDYRLREVGGHIYSYYPVATPLLVTPGVWIINKVYPLIYPTDFYTYLDQHAPDTRTAKLEKIFASGIAAVSAALIYLISRRELGILRALAITFIFVFSTSIWSTASRALWQHGPSALFLSAALYLALLVKQRRSLVLWMGMLLGFAYLIRPTNSLTVAFFGIYILVNYRRGVWLYALGLALILVPYVILNWLTYQNILPPYSYQLFERLATPKVFVEALAGTLVSPARGLLIFSPVFLFAIYGAYLRLRQNPTMTNIDLYLVGILLTHWITTSLFEDWAGAWSIGPRYFVDVIPLLAYFLIPIMQRNALAAPGWRCAFIISILVSMLIQFHCSTSIYPFMWNGKPRALVEAPERKWDWGDLQFLRGFCPNDPLEGRAPACWFRAND